MRAYDPITVGKRGASDAVVREVAPVSFCEGDVLVHCTLVALPVVSGSKGGGAGGGGAGVRAGVAEEVLSERWSVGYDVLLYHRIR